MASGNVAGRYELRAGKSPNKTRLLARMDSARADNAAGSNPYYVNGIEKPRDDGVPLGIGPGPHVRPGENLYIFVEADTSDGVDSDDPLAVLEINYAEYDQADGTTERHVINAVAQRNTTTTNGGLNDDPTVPAGASVPVYAFGPVPADSDRTLFGLLTINIRDDTA